MENEGKTGPFPADIARSKGWTVGTILREREEQRIDRYYEITAIGIQKVLGFRISDDAVEKYELDLSLCDEFITWAALRMTPEALGKMMKGGTDAIIEVMKGGTNG